MLELFYIDSDFPRILEFVARENLRDKKNAPSDIQIYIGSCKNVMKNGYMILKIQKDQFRPVNLLRLYKKYDFEVSENKDSWFISVDLYTYLQIIQNDTDNFIAQNMSRHITTLPHKYVEHLMESEKIPKYRNWHNVEYYKNTNERDSFLFINNLNLVDKFIHENKDKTDLSNLLRLTIRLTLPMWMITKIGIDSDTVISSHKPEGTVRYDNFSIKDKFFVSKAIIGDIGKESLPLLYHDYMSIANIYYSQIGAVERSTHILPMTALYKVVYTKTLAEWREVFKLCDYEARNTTNMVLNNAVYMLRNYKNILGYLVDDLKGIENNIFNPKSIERVE